MTARRTFLVLGSFLLLLLLTIDPCYGQKLYSLETLRTTTERSPSEKNQFAMDLTRRTLNRSDKRRLNQRIRKTLKDIVDVQVIVASNVEHDYTPKEMATYLINTWDMGNSTEKHVGAVLILAVMEENRIEIEFTDNLDHVLNIDWCHELLYTKVIPYFKDGLYADGLEQILIALQERFDEHRRITNANKKMRKRRGSGKRLAGLAALVGGGAYATHPYWMDEAGDDDDDLPSFHDDDEDDDRGVKLSRKDRRTRRRRPHGKRRWYGQSIFEDMFPNRQNTFFDNWGRNRRWIRNGGTFYTPPSSKQTPTNNINIFSPSFWRPPPPPPATATATQPRPRQPEQQQYHDTTYQHQSTTTSNASTQQETSSPQPPPPRTKTQEQINTASNNNYNTERQSFRSVSEVFTRPPSAVRSAISDTLSDILDDKQNNKIQENEKTTRNNKPPRPTAVSKSSPIKPEPPKSTATSNGNMQKDSSSSSSSTGLGGGAPWGGSNNNPSSSSSSTCHPTKKNDDDKKKKKKKNETSSSGMGGGATWSSSASSTASWTSSGSNNRSWSSSSSSKKSSKPSLSSSSSSSSKTTKKKSSSSSSGKGGGASW